MTVVAALFGVDAETVREWRDRFAAGDEGSLSGRYSRPRRGPAGLGHGRGPVPPRARLTRSRRPSPTRLPAGRRAHQEQASGRRPNPPRHQDAGVHQAGWATARRAAGAGGSGASAGTSLHVRVDDASA